MFWRIASHEISYRLRKASTHTYFLLFFALSYLLVNAAGGAFGSGTVIIAGTGPNTLVNSPFVLAITIAFLSLLGVIITAAFMGQTIHRDYDNGIDPLIFTTPVKKRDYLGGRFAGALLVNLYIFTAFGLGLMAGEITPWLDADKFGAFRLSGYVQPYVLFVIPNLLFTGALFFALAATTRQMLPNYIGGVLLFLGYNLASLLVGADAIQNSDVAMALDPFGFITLQQVTRYWTVAQQNAQVPALAGPMLYNRLLWVGLGLAAFGALYARFRFAHGGEGRSWRARLPTWLGGKKTDAPDAGAPETQTQPARLISRLQLPAVTRSFSLGSRARQFLDLSKRSFLEIVRDKYFYAILAAGVGFLLIGSDQVGRMSGTTVYPVTRIVADTLAGHLALFVIILIAFYAGRLVWRERDLGINQIHDAMPLSGSVFFASKLAALVGMVALLMGVVMTTGIATQAAYGYYRFEIGVYLQMLFGAQLLNYVLFCVLALTIHTVVNHKYLGHFLIIAYFVGMSFLSQLGLEHQLWRFSSGVGMPYSDMNGFGPFVERFTWMALHWSGVAVLLAVVAHLLWVRGTDASLKARWRHLRQRFSPQVGATVACVGLGLLGTGAFIVYNTNALNTFRTDDEQKALAAEYEKTYEKYKDRPQPRITAADLTVNLYPDRRDAEIQGRYRLRNKTNRPIDSVHVNLSGGDNETRALSFAGRQAQAVLTDSVQNYRIYRLARPLAPGDTLAMRFEQAVVTEGFSNSGPNTQVVENGTFLSSGVLPGLGYDESAELSNPDDRKNYGLAPEPRMPALGDSSAQRDTYITDDADWIDFSATVSTSAEQRAFAPGTLVRSWTGEDGRSHFRYRAQAPMLNFYTFLSGNYAQAQGQWHPDSSGARPVDLSIYYAPAHDFNIERMMTAAKKSLDYFTANFGPYQNDYLRIIEFPRYRGGFAQAFLGTVPFSESMGFILRVDEEEDINFPFYVTAHEVAHQWWAHQIVGANVQGATVLSETLAQYSALMVMEEAYGKDAIHRFLEYELDRYLMGRSQEERKELPLMRVENQQYIHYRKGALVMYALKDYMGEDRLNRALRRFVTDEKFTQPPYPTSRDLVGHIERAAPDSLQPVIDDFFRKIVLYENRASEATYTQTDSGRYRVELAVNAKKVEADSLGSATEVEMGDWIDVGVFAPAEAGNDLGDPLYLEKHQIESGEQTITVTVDEQPARAGIDPYRKLIDRDTGDNVTGVTRASDE